jgi:hypothetical protein
MKQYQSMMANILSACDALD